ncbi:MAG: 5,10-methylenetetrahydrofolate reductase [Dehalococcoidia bacterium]|nr:MAG: 5,10-methylenetetrahydrofolate reductase [Dehalococcoidia bacterium]
MKISDLIKTRGKSLSFEFFPPRTPMGEDQLLKRINTLKTHSPSFISVSQHAGPNTLERTKHTIGILRKETDLTIMPHITCADPARAELIEVMEYYKNIGIENILALRGDPAEYGANVFDGVNHYCHASDLVKFIASHQNFCIGVGVYPEGHPESDNLGIDTSRVKNKIEQGADFCISQMFFENFYYYQMLDRFIQDGINIPVIAGIMPITDFQKVEYYAEQGGVEIPVPVVAKFEELDDPNDVLKAGIDFATEQCLDLWENGVRCFHFYTLNRDEVISRILGNLALTFSQTP